MDDQAEDFTNEDEAELVEGEECRDEAIPFDFPDATNHRDYVAQQMWEEYGLFIRTNNIEAADDQ